ncbi:hypothetical protein EYF80_059147 [Liparis tanakae]|uniref:Uncharacterized protein n=1 Tax=Liparis tanakae TaxID=230148 RepID=A0A4Z2EQ60_9TELE|nr:hypothetical protein EYF80_059147 [Liparis tanakae]
MAIWEFIPVACYAPLRLPISTQSSRIHQLQLIIPSAQQHHQVWTPRGGRRVYLVGPQLQISPVESRRQRL